MFSIIVLNSTRIVLNSSAAETQPRPNTDQKADTCTMNVEVYVKEQLADGTNEILNFSKHPELDHLKWGFSDTINQLPYANPPYTIQFTHPTQAKYTNFVNELSFVAFPNQSQIYASEENTDITITYQDALYDIVQQEIKTCSLHGSDEWLCSSDNVSDLRTISDIPVKCGMNLSIGWIVEKSDGKIAASSSSRQFSQTKPIQDTISTDINMDGATTVLDLSSLISTFGSHDPQSDINKDGNVNGQDYVLMLEVISNQKIN